MRYFLLILAFLFASCAANPVTLDAGLINHRGHEVHWEDCDFPLKVLADSEMSTEYRASTLLAAVHWNETVDRNLFEVHFQTFREPAPGRCGWVSVEASSVLGTDPPPPAALRYAYTTFFVEDDGEFCLAQIDVDDELSGSLLQLIMIHEFGHALGLAHDSLDRDSVMYPSIDATSFNRKITEEDIKTIQDMYDGAHIRY